MTLTRSIAEFASSFEPRDIPEAAMATIKSGLVDVASATLAGSGEPIVRILLQRERDKARPADEASVLFGSARASAESAALVNGTAAHALSYDDVAFMAHPSAVLAPAALAEGQRLHAPGARLLSAYLVGYETWGELNARESDPCHGKGWHATSALGTVAATAAVCHMRRVDADTAAHALGISASMAGGVMANFGSMTKPLHAGRVGLLALQAVDLAVRGVTASPEAIAHPMGLLGALSPKGRVDLDRPASLGRDWRILATGLSFKKYPNCYSTHRVIDAVIDMARDHGLKPDDVASVHATIGKVQAGLCKHHDPKTALEAKFSLEFAVASALISGNVGIAELNEAYLGRADVQALMKRVSMSTVDTICPIEPAFGFADRVIMTLRDGKRIDSGDIRFARGHALNPMKAADSERKFMDCCRIGDFEDAAGLLDRLRNIERMDDLNRLAAAAMPMLARSA